MQELLDLRKALFTAKNLGAEQVYEKKKQIIRDNLFGVDIDRFATNIAMLRLWLSLVVDDTREPLESGDSVALPNLDFKIECGDSLKADSPQAGLFTARIGELIEAKNLFFASVKPSEKKIRKAGVIAMEEELMKSYSGTKGASVIVWEFKFPEVFVKRPAHSTLRGTLNFSSDELAPPDREPGFDIVIANPPYGSKSEGDLRIKYFGQGTTQSKDPYGLFIARGLQLVRSTGMMSFIISDTWRTIKSHKTLRELLLRESKVQELIDVPSWIFDATVNTTIVNLTRMRASESDQVTAVDLRAIPVNDWKLLSRLLSIVETEGGDVQTLTFAKYIYPQALIASYSNKSFFIGSPRLYNLQARRGAKRVAFIAETKVGLQTSDNHYYLRSIDGKHPSYDPLEASELLTPSQIRRLTLAEKTNGISSSGANGRVFVPFDKGESSDSDEGWLPNFFVPTKLAIDWSKSAVKRLKTATIAEVKARKGKENQITATDRTKVAAYIRNPQFYFKEGITYSPTGHYSPTFRLGSASIFGNKGSTLFLVRGAEFSLPQLMGILCCLTPRYFLKVYLSHTVETGEEVLGQCILPALTKSELAKIETLVLSIIGKQKEDPQYPFFKFEQKEIDEIVNRGYNLSAEDVREVKLWYCRRYPALARAQGVIEEVREEYGEFLKQGEKVIEQV